MWVPRLYSPSHGNWIIGGELSGTGKILNEPKSQVDIKSTVVFNVAQESIMHFRQ